MPKKIPTCTEGCGGEKVFSWMSLMVYGYLGIYRQKIRSGGSRGEGGHKAGGPRKIIAKVLFRLDSV